MDATRSHILVIDDEPTIREVMTEILRDEGLRVTTHHTYFDELDAVIALEPDLIILDIFLHGRSGLDFITLLKADLRTAKIPICVCTGATHLDEKIAAALDEWDCLIMFKPFEIDEFVGEIHRCLKHHGFRPASA